MPASSSQKTETVKVRQRRLFKGDQDSPLLAPRGVFLVGKKLIVSDTGQNRVFIWNHLPETEHQKSDVVLGQTDDDLTSRNAGGKVSASTLMYPSGLWSDGQKLIVADAWNHRVLIWREMPRENGQPADVVIGQPDFDRNEPNVAGVGTTPSARSLHWPYGVWSDGNQLWIADTGNRRVLYFQQIPRVSYSPADNVIGKSGFEERDYNSNDAIWPYSVKVSPGGALAITDTQYYRILLWRDWKKALQQPADVIIGQPDFEANGQNQFGWFPDRHTLNWCYDAAFYKDGIWVADTGNSRLLWFEHLPESHNAPANAVLGQDDFKTGSENKNTIKTTEDSLYWPFHLSIQDRLLVVADTGNHRLVINHLES